MVPVDLLTQLRAARAQTDAVFSWVSENGMLARPIGERHRVLFYRGHLEAFEFNTLSALLGGLPARDASLNALFARGIDPTDGCLPTDTAADWPQRPTIDAYVAATRALVDGVVFGTPSAHYGVSQEDVTEAMHMLLEHRLMHMETLMYMLHQLPQGYVRVPKDASAPAAPRVPPVPTMRTIPAGDVTLGQKRAPGGFGWDNEFNAHVVHVADFKIDTYPVTHAQFMRFVEAGGYHNAALWRRADWEWVCRTGREHPEFWQRGPRGQWLWRSLGGVIPLPADWPVFVSHAEARAYAAFCDKALPTEAQWQRACTGTAEGHERLYPWGDASPAHQHGNFGMRRHTPVSVQAHPQGASAFGVHDMLGNGWEWTRTPFAPFAGFSAHPLYPGYSADFFDNHHYVLKGGSMCTGLAMLRRSFRNWFQPHYPFVYATFRCVKDV